MVLERSSTLASYGHLVLHDFLLHCDNKWYVLYRELDIIIKMSKAFNFHAFPFMDYGTKAGKRKGQN